MEENTSLLDTKVSDLTVKQTLVVQLAAPIVVMGGLVLAGAVFGAAGSIAKKFKKSPELAIVTNDEE